MYSLMSVRKLNVLPCLGSTNISRLSNKTNFSFVQISSGLKCEFVQDIAAINTKEKHCCILGKLNKRAVLTPDMDSLLASIDNSY